MSYKNKVRAKPKSSSLPLMMMGVGLMIIAIAVLVFVPGEASPIKAVGEGIPPPRLVSYPAPELELTDLNGELVSLAGITGQVVLVNHWATWCPPCRAEMPDLEAYFRAHKNDGFTLVGINSGDQREQVVDFQREVGLTFPLWLDPDSLALRAFQSSALPSSFLIDKTGTIRFVWMGAVNLEALETYVTPLLGNN
jgi:peroxiredoxin